MHGRRSRGGILFPYNDRINQVGRIARAVERARLNQRHTVVMEDGRENPPINPPPPMNFPPNQQFPQMNIPINNPPDIPPRQITMGQYSRPVIGGLPPAIVLDELTKSYELKTMHINQLPSFYGKTHEDCLQFMKDLNGVVETFPFTSREGRLTREQLLMRCFSTCLKDSAKKWLNTQRPGSLTSWDMVCEAFFNRFFPSNKKRELRMQITGFQEESGDSFHETWERFQLLLAQLPPHMLPDEYKVSSFQEGLSPQTQLLITNACGGSTADKTAAFVMDVCERLAHMSQQCNFNSRTSGRHEVGGGTETAIEVSKLAKQMQSMQATMLSMQAYMTNQGNASLIQGRDGSGDVPFDGCVGFQEEVQAMGYQQRDGGGGFPQTYNPNLRNYPNLSWTNNNNRGYYQGQGSGSSQANQWNRQENFNNQARQQVEPVLPDGQRLSTLEALVTHMGASMKNMEIQLGQVAEALSKQENGTFPSQPEQAKSITVLLNGKGMNIEEKGGGMIEMEGEVDNSASNTTYTALPPKLKDPGNFVINVSVGGKNDQRAMFDLGAGINVMPYTVYKHLGLHNLKPSSMSLVLADQSIRSPKGIVEDVLIRVGKLSVSADFVVLEMDGENKRGKELPILLGRPFMATTEAVIDVKNGRLSMKVLGEVININIFNSLELLCAVDCFTVDVIESGKLSNTPNDYLDELLAILDEEEEVHVKEAPKEIDQLKSQNEELILEMDLLKKQKILLQKKVEETVQEKEQMKKNFERKMQVMKDELEGKVNALNIMRVKECEYIVKLDKSEQAIKALTNKPTMPINNHGGGNPLGTSRRKNVPKSKNPTQPKIPSRDASSRKIENRKERNRQPFHPRGKLYNLPPTCYFCSRSGHIKSQCHDHFKSLTMQNGLTWRKVRVVKQVWVRKGEGDPLNNTTQCRA